MAKSANIKRHVANSKRELFLNVLGEKSKVPEDSCKFHAVVLDLLLEIFSNGYTNFDISTGSFLGKYSMTN